MKNTTYIILLMILASTKLSSQQVRYIACDNCTFSNYSNENTTYTYNGGIVSFDSEDVSSDYGPRLLSGDYDWHGGVDFSNETSSNDIGDAIVAIEGGTINNLVLNRAGYKYMTIDGNNDFGYGHIFTSKRARHKVGGFYLRELKDENPVDGLKAIITPDNRALFINSNAMVVSPITNTDIITTNTVTIGQTIAPIGTSYGSSETAAVEAHLHLYSFENGNFNTRDCCTKNPLQHVDHNTPNYCIKVLKQNDTDEGVALTYPGTNPTTLQARVTMDNDQICGNGTTLTSGNYPSINNIEFLQFQLQSSLIQIYQTIIDENDDPIGIAYGGFNGLTITPPTVRTHVGSWTDLTGVYPEAYRTNPWDDIYTHEFATRLHKNFHSGTLTFTDIPQNAMYNDDMYNIRARMTDIKLQTHEGSSTSFTLDNFQPFLDAIGFVTNSTYRYYLNRMQLDYSGLNDGYLVNLHTYNDIASMSLQPYTLVVNVSEPMQSISVDYQIDGTSTWISGGNMTKDPNNPLRYTWSGSPLTDGCYKFRFAGQDKSGNDLMNVYDMTDENDTYDLASIPVRSSATQWTNQDNDHQTGYDYVNLCINASSCNFGNLIGKTYHSHNRSAVNCDDLSNLYTSVYYDCSKGEYQIQLQGVPQGFDVGWAEGSNAYAYTGSMTYNAVNPGLYCYIIGSDNPCCYTEGCVTVTGDETPTFNFEYEFTNSSTSSTANLQITSPNPTSMALNVYIRLYDSNGNQVQSTTVLSANGIPPIPFTNLIIGDEYCLRYEDANGCTEEYCFTVEGETCPNSIYFDEEIEVVNETCEDGQGSITITAFYASFNCLSSNLSFLWSNGDTDGFADGLSAGTYCVTLTASGGSCDDCIAVRCFEIENICGPCDEPIQVDAWTGDICRSIIEHTWKGQTYYELIITNGWIIVNASGGFGNLTITWDDGNYGWQRVIDTPGEYCATITDECGNTEMKCWTIGTITTDHYCLSPYFEQTHMRGSLDSIENNWNSYQQQIVVNDSIALNNTAYHSDSIHYDIHNSLVSAIVGKIQITKSNFMSSSHSELEQITHQEAVLLHEEEKEIYTNPLTIRCLPNPFSHDLTVQLESANEEEGQLTVYSMNGEKYYSKKVWLKEGRNTYNIGDEVILLPSGIYIVNFTLRSGKTCNEKVIKI